MQAVPPALEASFEQLSHSIPAAIGIAIVPASEANAWSFGSWSTGVAWSTIKVPLAIAALRADRLRAAGMAAKAITESDNVAAEGLWSLLGRPTEAAKQVQAVITEAGDPATVVESRRLRRGFTAFGQTQWSLRQQAQFAAHLPRLTDAGAVIDLMRNLADGHRWGLAVDGTAAKGGWGPDEIGGYLARQFGVVSTRSSQLGVALAADAADGTLRTAVSAIDRMAQWLISRRSELPGGS